MNNFKKGQFTSINSKVFKSIFDDFYTPLCRHAHLFISDESSCEEIVQELYIRLWEKRYSINISTSIRSYLYKSVRNRCFNYLRDNKAKLPIDDTFADIENEIIDEISMHDNMDLEDMQSHIDKAINELPPRCREIFILSRESHLSYKEIAEKMSLSQKTIENQMGIALKRLKDDLSPLLFLLLHYL